MTIAATVLAVLAGVHILAKFTFFMLPYRRRRAALDKAYGGKVRATAKSDAASLILAAAMVIVLFLAGVKPVSFLIGLWVGATLIQLYFHQFYEPLTREQEPPSPAGPIKVMSYAIEARPWRPWPEIVMLAALVVAAFVAMGFGGGG
ncbi:hypothetical protein [Mycobacterium sp. E2497]|uniref:hypothetical protein n=1 Tax=Mycobacterium sp. E2497 TaxID=1834135 RepID=UPI000801982F|nr:hypothetical protein [Mycobacterium sp. E2497]OBI11516.1 hypothetical protein A5713_00395 [Mycobacterium sp. E2497]